MRIEVENWPMRRRVIISLLENPRTNSASLMQRAERLASLCEENGHPECAKMIRSRLVDDHRI